MCPICNAIPIFFNPLGRSDPASRYTAVWRSKTTTSRHGDDSCNQGCRHIKAGRVISGGDAGHDQTINIHSQVTAVAGPPEINYQLFHGSSVVMNKADDNQLIQSCITGDRQALESLLVRYEKPVYNAAYRMLNSPDDASDVTQTVFLKVFENLDRYDPEYRIFSWIYRIALNESINCLNKRSRTQALEQEPQSVADGPEQATAGEQRSQEVQAALASIKSEYRMVIVLKHFLECSYLEIGQILDIPEKKVKSRLYSARQLLKDALNKRGLH
jgi:RNA polymerase sigma-70 factor (ECF subfamily)